jgi:hypothetical protein
MLRKHPLLVGILFAGGIAALGLAGVAYAHDDDHPPSPGQIAFAEDVSNLLVNEVVAALFKEFDETTPQNVEHGKQAISLIFNDANRDIRLIGAFGPLQGGANNRPGDRFETTALKRALDTGDAYATVQKINDTWYYRRSVPLSNTLHPNCVLCHTNFTTEFFNRTGNPDQRVGALVLAVPIRPARSH